MRGWHSRKNTARVGSSTSAAPPVRVPVGAYSRMAAVSGSMTFPVLVVSHALHIKDGEPHLPPLVARALEGGRGEVAPTRPLGVLLVGAPEKAVAHLGDRREAHGVVHGELIPARAQRTGSRNDQALSSAPAIFARMPRFPARARTSPATSSIWRSTSSQLRSCTTTRRNSSPPENSPSRTSEAWISRSRSASSSACCACCCPSHSMASPTSGKHRSMKRRWALPYSLRTFAYICVRGRSGRSQTGPQIRFTTLLS